MRPTIDKLEGLYSRYNHREYVHPDPLEFLYKYSKIEDREIIGLISASLAYGNVKQIIRSVSIALQPLGESPRNFIESISKEQLVEVYANFKHRFTTGKDLAIMLIGMKDAINKHGSLNKCYLNYYSDTDPNIIKGLTGFTQELGKHYDGCAYLLPSPERGSACKRMNLYLRWMVRSDDVDPGGWDGISESKLIYPVDLHIHRLAKAFGFTNRSQANLRTAIEITEAFRDFSPEDPVKYDFSLTRLGIHPKGHYSEILGDNSSD